MLTSSFSDAAKPLLVAIVSASSIANIDFSLTFPSWKEGIENIDVDKIFTAALDEVLRDAHPADFPSCSETIEQLRRDLDRGPMIDQLKRMTQVAFASARILAASSILQPKGERNVLHEFVCEHIAANPEHRTLIEYVRHAYVSRLQPLINLQKAA